MSQTRRPNLTIEEKIEKAQRSVVLAKERYDNAVDFTL